MVNLFTSLVAFFLFSEKSCNRFTPVTGSHYLSCQYGEFLRMPSSIGNCLLSISVVVMNLFASLVAIYLVKNVSSCGKFKAKQKFGFSQNISAIAVMKNPLTFTGTFEGI